MAPPKSSKAGHDDSKADAAASSTNTTATTTTTAKEKNGHGSGSHNSNGKLRRVVSTTGPQPKEVAPNAITPAPTLGAPAQEAVVPGVSLGVQAGFLLRVFHF